LDRAKHSRFACPGVGVLPSWSCRTHDNRSKWR